MSYPVDIETTPTPNASGGDTLLTVPHDALHAYEVRLIGALQAKLGVDGSVVTTSHDYKLSGVTGSDKAASAATLAAHTANVSNPHAVTKAQVGLGNADNTSDATKLAAVLAAVYPIGSIYANATDGTNPAFLLGFGTWVAYAVGQVLVGKAGSGTFQTAGSTGGSETHFHWQTVGMDGTVGFGEINGSGSGHTRVTSVNRITWAVGGGAVGSSRDDGTYDDSSLQPYIVGYMWKRTA